MMISKKNYDGFRPNQVSTLLDIPGTTFRYWRENLELTPGQEVFTFKDIFKYRVLKFLIREKSVHVKKLKQIDYLTTFKQFDYMSFAELKSYMVIFNIKSYELKLDKRNMEKMYCPHFNNIAYLDILYEEQSEALENYGFPSKNIIAFRKQHKKYGIGA